MDGQRAIVEKIGGAVHQAQGVEETERGVAIGKIEGEHCAKRSSILPGEERMGRVRGQTGISDAQHLRTSLEPLCQSQGGGSLSTIAHFQRFEAERLQMRHLRRHVGAQIEEGLVGNALGEMREMPVVDDHTAQRGGTAAHIFGARHHFNVYAQRPAVEFGERNHRGVGHQRYLAAVRHRGQCTHVGNFELRIGEDLEKEAGRVLIDGRFERIGAREIAQTHFDSETRQRFGEQRIGVSKKMAGSDHVGAGGGERKERGTDGGHARVESNGSSCSRDSRHAVLEMGDGGVRHTRIVGGGDAFAENIGHRRRVVEFIRHTFIDRHTQGVVSIATRISAVNGTGVSFHVSCSVLMCCGGMLPGRKHSLFPKQYTPAAKIRNLCTRGHLKSVICERGPRGGAAQTRKSRPYFCFFMLYQATWRR